MRFVKFVVKVDVKIYFYVPLVTIFNSNVKLHTLEKGSAIKNYKILFKIFYYIYLKSFMRNRQVFVAKVASFKFLTKFRLKV